MQIVCLLKKKFLGFLLKLGKNVSHINKKTFYLPFCLRLPEDFPKQSSVAWKRRFQSKVTKVYQKCMDKSKIPMHGNNEAVKKSLHEKGEINETPYNSLAYEK
jgi:hypothetical protein